MVFYNNPNKRSCKMVIRHETNDAFKVEKEVTYHVCGSTSKSIQMAILDDMFKMKTATNVEKLLHEFRDALISITKEYGRDMPEYLKSKLYEICMINQKKDDKYMLSTRGISALWQLNKLLLKRFCVLQSELDCKLESIDTCIWPKMITDYNTVYLGSTCCSNDTTKFEKDLFYYIENKPFENDLYCEYIIDENNEVVKTLNMNRTKEQFDRILDKLAFVD